MPPRWEIVERVIDDTVIATGDVWTVIEPVWWLANRSGTPAEYEDSLSRFSSEQRLIFALRWYISEVQNGGHLQFYSNFTGIVWRDAANAMTALGVAAGASIILASAARMGGTASLIRAERQDAISRYKPDFSDLDQAFYELAEQINLDETMLNFIRTHSAAFHFIGSFRKLVLPTGNT